MSTSFNTTSRHLLIAILEALCIGDNTITVLKKSVGNGTDDIPVELKNKNIEIISVPVVSSKKGNFASRFINDVRYVTNCKKCIKSDFDAVFVQSSNVAGFVFKHLRKRFPNAVKTYNAQDIFPENAVFSGNIKKNGLVYKVLSHFQRLAYEDADHIITISEDMREFLINSLGVKSEKIEVIYNWSYHDDIYIKPDTAVLSGFFNPNFFNVVYAGNIGVMQNVDVLIEAARIMKSDSDVWFSIIGDGVYKQKLEDKARHYCISNISFWPLQSSNLALDIYSPADVNVIPLVKDIYRTAMPSKTASCLACQKPIILAIGRDSEFGKILTENADCLVVDSNNPEELVEAIRKIRIKSETNKMGAFFKEYCNKKINSSKYAQIITIKGD